MNYMNLILHSGIMREEMPVNHHDRVETAIEKYKPALVQFDPFYMIFSGEMIKQQDIVLVAQWRAGLHYAHFF